RLHRHMRVAGWAAACGGKGVVAVAEARFGAGVGYAWGARILRGCRDVIAGRITPRSAIADGYRGRGVVQPLEVLWRGKSWTAAATAVNLRYRHWEPPSGFEFVMLGSKGPTLPEDGAEGSDKALIGRTISSRARTMQSPGSAG